VRWQLGRGSDASLSCYLLTKPTRTTWSTDTIVKMNGYLTVSLYTVFKVSPIESKSRLISDSILLTIIYYVYTQSYLVLLL
jgi:hypothetical protein